VQGLCQLEIALQNITQTGLKALLTLALCPGSRNSDRRFLLNRSAPVRQGVTISVTCPAQNKSHGFPWLLY